MTAQSDNEVRWLYTGNEEDKAKVVHPGGPWLKQVTPKESQEACEKRLAKSGLGQMPKKIKRTKEEKSTSGGGSFADWEDQWKDWDVESTTSGGKGSAAASSDFWGFTKSGKGKRSPHSPEGPPTRRAKEEAWRHAGWD